MKPFIAHSRTSSPEAELLREANLRVSGHLGLLVGMLQARATALESGPGWVSREAARAALEETVGILISVGKLECRPARRTPTSEVKLSEYIPQTCAALISSRCFGQRVCVAYKQTANCRVSTEQAQYIGLLLDEILTNAVRHAHPTGIPVQLAVACERHNDGRLTISIADDGVGLPEKATLDTLACAGFKLIRALAHSLNADLSIETDALGLTLLITLPSDVRAANTNVIS